MHIDLLRDLKLFRELCLKCNARVVLCPHGTLTQLLLDTGLFNGLNVVAVADSTPRFPCALNEIPVIDLSQIYRVNPEVIFVCSLTFSREILQTISSMQQLRDSTIVDLAPYFKRELEPLNDLYKILAITEIERLKQSIKLMNPHRLELNGYKCYSQHDEDGIINEIIRRIPHSVEKTFVEFGVGDGLENNTLFLLKQGWSGLWLEIDSKNIRNIEERFQEPILSGQLSLMSQRVTVHNINSLIGEWGVREVGLLSIDVDGNDLYIWERISVIEPSIVVIEYNAKFPPPKRWSIHYDDYHSWDFSDYQGASLQKLVDLATAKGYILVCCNLNGTNAFFIKKKLITPDFADAGDVYKLYHPPRYYLTKAYSGAYGHPASSKIGKWD